MFTKKKFPFSKVQNSPPGAKNINENLSSSETCSHEPTASFLDKVYMTLVFQCQGGFSVVHSNEFNLLRITHNEIRSLKRFCCGYHGKLVKKLINRLHGQM